MYVPGAAPERVQRSLDLRDSVARHVEDGVEGPPLERGLHAGLVVPVSPQPLHCLGQGAGGQAAVEDRDLVTAAQQFLD